LLLNGRINKRKMTYNKDFDIPANSFDFAKDLKFGQQGETFIGDFYAAVIQGSAEVKTDRYRNGRMVVETNQNPRRETDVFGVQIWSPSGINVTKAAWWIYVYAIHQSMVIVNVQRLKRYLRVNRELFNEQTKKVFAGSSDNPAKGFLLEPEQVMEMLYSIKYDKTEE